jgi:hypothetical protein
VSIKLGDDTVVLVKVTSSTTETDDYGNPVKGLAYRELRWCLLTPARSSEPFDRGSPAVVGANLLAPPVDHVGRRTYSDIAAADRILSDWTKQADGAYTGRAWEILGEVGLWDEAVECLLRRLL